MLNATSYMKDDPSIPCCVWFMKHLARNVQFRSMVQRGWLKGTSLQTPFVATRFNASLSNENFKQFKHVILIYLPKNSHLDTSELNNLRPVFNLPLL